MTTNDVTANPLIEQAVTALTRRATLLPVGATVSGALDELAKALKTTAADLDTALAADPRFRREERAGKVFVSIEKAGRTAPPVADWRPSHDFGQRLNPNAAPISEEQRQQLTDQYAARAQANRAALLRAREDALRQEAENLRTATAAAERMVGLDRAATSEDDLLGSDFFAPSLEMEQQAEVELALPLPDFSSQPVAETAATPAAEIAPTPVALVAATPVATIMPVAPLAPPVVEAAPRNLTYTLETANGPQTVDLSHPVDDLYADYGSEFEQMLRRAVADDFRFVNFGGQWYLEDMVERLSKGDLRRIKEFLAETNDAVSDTTFLGDVLGKRPDQPDYEVWRFSLNYRLLKEKKEFEFVGVDNERLWLSTTANLFTPKRKISELGQDFRFLEEPSLAGDGFNHLSEEDGKRRLHHTLTYYEYDNGLIPYDDAAKEFFPSPVMDDQRAAVFRFESPQLYLSFVAELRYSSGNRGGYIVGLDEFYQNLVPGATFTLEATPRANIYTLTYERLKGSQEERLLQYDERRARYIYRPVVFNVQTEPAMLITEGRYPRLEGLHKLEDADRKKPENIVAHAFERVGEASERDGSSGFVALLDDIHPVVNIERPFSKAYLRAILTSSQYPYFAADPDDEGLYYYTPGKR